MKRLALYCMLFAILILVTGLCQTAIDPDAYTGQWYSAEDQSIYQFYDGLITCSKHDAELSAAESISGAYTYCKDSIFLFAKGIEGLETEKELYLVHKGEGSFLCESIDGNGKYYFVRYHNEK